MHNVHVYVVSSNVCVQSSYSNDLINVVKLPSTLTVNVNVILFLKEKKIIGTILINISLKLEEAFFTVLMYIQCRSPLLHYGIVQSSSWVKVKHYYGIIQSD